MKQIQGLVNFAEMQNHFDRNLTITLKGQGNDSSSIFQQDQSTLHLNFNYMFIREPYNIEGNQSEQNLAMIPVTHILQNLYFNFVLPLKDFEIIKSETLKLINIEP